MTEVKKRGRPPLSKDGAMRVKKPEAIHDGEGGFLPVGATFDPVDADAGERLKALGLAE